MPAVSARSFGLHISKATALSSPQTPWHDVGQGSTRLWDTGTNWRAIETAKGVFDWAKLDANVALSIANNCHILFTLGQAPNWATGNTSSSQYGTAYNSIPPTDDQDWVDFIEALVQRLPAGSAYEVWNEPDLTGFYSGSVARLIELHILAYDTIKALDPTAIIVSACPTGSAAYFYSYLPGVVGKTDVIGMHTYMYPRPPEASIQIIKWVRSVARKSGHSGAIWDTEGTWNTFKLAGVTTGPPVSVTYLASSPLVMPGDLAAAYVARQLLCLFIGGGDRQYFYGLDHGWSALRMVADLSNPGIQTDAAAARRYVSRLLMGASLSRFRQVPPLYSVDWSGGGTRGRIFWCDDDATQVVDLSVYKRGTDVLGNPIELSVSYEVAHSPVFLLQ
jgi:hypothetical protein